MNNDTIYDPDLIEAAIEVYNTCRQDQSKTIECLVKAFLDGDDAKGLKLTDEKVSDYYTEARSLTEYIESHVIRKSQ